jgi:hypothetical protein
MSPATRKKSHCAQQQFAIRQGKEARKSFEVAIDKEEDRFQKQELLVLNAVTKAAIDTFGFAVDIDKMTLHNASNYLSTMSTQAYFNRATNMAFHNLGNLE